MFTKGDFQSPEFKWSQSIHSFRIAGHEYPRILYGYERGEFAESEIAADECPDCDHPTGFYHDLGCELEQCPCCEQQALGCACAYEKRPHEFHPAA